MKKTKSTENKKVRLAFSSLIPKNKVVEGKNLPIPKFIYSSLVVSGLGIFFVILMQNNLPPELPLFYGLPEGEDQLTTSLGLVTPAIISFIITLINTGLVFFLQNKFLQKTLILSSFAISILSVITIVKIALLVGSF
ncbi:hypothetical protein A2714_03630 [Candidatus Woesebacteria bacterium RIFCSPHIGHO2_01_FULL_38_9]|uniref:DUF1648 domain-containing protein n=2 Tax=Candidatus Woeseibacteriota TaxID=1752722 RepID=A0A1F7Y2G9_9BACT|nr:MAG: hypothetical protein A2714_03630 [Candidatus Woesebacteria bacterium RIFCSPHIGHO2_01_FULL_38_9]OGM63933.1 MAG: hypothetical protein A2893_00270 [Candidatus Woesebacteria bacterium RIFCSPLOWO2_01_FULL_39_25]